MDEHPEVILLLKSLLDASIDGVLAFDLGCRYTAWNRAMEHISGVSRGEVLGRIAFEVFPFLRETGEDFCFFEALAGRRAVSADRPYRIPETGREGFFEGHYSPLYGGGGEIIGGLAVVRDITEQRRAQETAREAHQRLLFHIENSPLAVIEWDSDFRLTRWSSAAERLFGWEAGEVLGKRIGDWRFVFNEDLAEVEQVSERQRRGIERQRVSRNRNYTKDGAVRWCEWYNSVLRDEAGGLISVLSHVLDVTERREAMAREMEARKEAEAANRVKDEFVATVSHELRTPLTSILGWANLLRTGTFDDKTTGEAIETIERNAESQKRLIDDLLDVSRITTGKLRLNVRPITLLPVVEAAVDGVRPAAAGKDIRLRVSADPIPGLISGDPDRLQQVVWNLLSNAVKFTPEGGDIQVRLERTNSRMVLVVSDSGQGISPEFQRHVFDRFRQADQSTTREHGGLGLGLAIVRHLVELHGGTVSVESGGEGQGSTFTVALPLLTTRQHTPADARAVPADRPLHERPVRHGGNLVSGLRVLVVEDDEDALALMKIALTTRGAQVTTAASAAEALSVLGDVKPDVMICDIGMPQVDGYELIRRVRALPPEGGGSIPAVALTAYTREEDRRKALAAGFQAHLAKPLTPDELASAIAGLGKS